VFEILRNARVLRPHVEPDLVVCWGGHAISAVEYLYTKKVGYELGLRNLDICTGCGPGAMKGPMKGATIGHQKQRRKSNRYIGVTEPGIIAAESPNPIVNHLVIMPDIEKRLEAFVRIAHAMVVFPGGVGTAEEILYLLGIFRTPTMPASRFRSCSAARPSPRPTSSRSTRSCRLALGDAIAKRYQIIIGDPGAVGRAVSKGVAQVREYRVAQQDAFFFNWGLHINHEFQQPFAPTHANMAALDLRRDQPVHELAADLRRAFSGIVAGNVKEEGMRAIEQHGLFELTARLR
jgi:predicted Rossmann-fold nucleotide-binding protein